ncbi:MAG TPA: hypothetical protein VF587_13210 [Solirubrobacteraceae bacterium]
MREASAPPRRRSVSRRSQIRCHNPGIEEAFGTVLLLVVIAATIAAVISMHGARYDHVGRGGLFEDDNQMRREPAPAVAAAERDDEIRQMLTARNARREAKGQAPLDVEDELRRLTQAAPATDDPALVAEVRQLVVARNERRVRQGKAPLDVEEEVQRQLRELGGGA